jgi:hypothetical protein
LAVFVSTVSRKWPDEEGSMVFTVPLFLASGAALAQGFSDHRARLARKPGGMLHRDVREAKVPDSFGARANRTSPGVAAAPAALPDRAPRHA